jgi:hypothetical protein
MGMRPDLLYKLESIEEEISPNPSSRPSFVPIIVFKARVWLLGLGQVAHRAMGWEGWGTFGM